MKPVSLEEAEITVKAVRDDYDPPGYTEVPDKHDNENLSEYDEWNDLTPKQQKSHKDYVRACEDNDWLWCTIYVFAKWGGLQGTAIMGACSYDSEMEFMLDGYYPDMVDEALEDLNTYVAAAQRPCEVCGAGEVCTETGHPEVV